MALKPEISVPAALATGALVYSVYSRGVPPIADVRTVEAGNVDIEAARKTNAWIAAGVVAGVSLIARDPTIFIVGGAMVVALDWTTRHANWVSPLTGKIEGVLDRAGQSVPTQMMADEEYGPPDLSVVGY